MIKGVSACLVTRGNVDISPIVDSLPFEDIVIWDNSVAPDAGSYGRYLAINHAKNDIIYIQDDDAIIPLSVIDRLVYNYEDGKLVASMPDTHVPELYTDICLTGWGSMFRRDLPQKAFALYEKHFPDDVASEDWTKFLADFVFPGLTPFNRINGDHENMPWATDDGRTYRQPGYEEKRARIIARIREVKRLESI